MKSHPFIDSLQGRSTTFDIINIRNAMKELGNPQDSYKSILIAGTNGKGSVTAMIANGLPNVGMLTSPHFHEINERIKVNGEGITDEDLNRLIEKLKPLALNHNLTFYETLVAVAFVYFAEKQISYAVLEVGLGGRLDATNIVTPSVSVITNIEFEHTDVLGDTIAKIATEKAGIIKGGIAITTEKKPEALAAIEMKCNETGAKLIHAERKDFNLTLKGDYQQDNAACAYEALLQLGVPAENARRAVETAAWPGRLEQRGDILFDCAHNPAAMKALAYYLKGKEFNLILAVKEDKAYEEMCSTICPSAKKVFVTQFTNGPTPLPAKKLAEAVSKYASDYEIIEDPTDALEKSEGFTVVAGSIFLVAQLLSP